MLAIDKNRACAIGFQNQTFFEIDEHTRFIVFCAGDSCDNYSIVDELYLCDTSVVEVSLTLLQGEFVEVIE